MAGGSFDVIVIGAGHNGLTTACLLAKKGRRVLVLERRDVTGGLCAGEEFHPGYRSPGLLHDTACIRPAVVDTLQLTAHGLELIDEPAVFSPQRDGRGLLLHSDAAAAASEIAVHSEKDANAYHAFRVFLEKVRGLVEPVLNDPLPDLESVSAGGMFGLLRHGLSFRSLGRKHMMELFRVPPMCVADWLREYFETELLNASLATPAILGTWCGPWSPGTAANLIIRECTARRAVRGGGAALVGSLESAARSLGVDIRTASGVERIDVKKGSVSGVTLAGGETIDGRAVVSSLDPKSTFLSLVRPHDIQHKFEHRVQMWRMRGTTAKVHLAVNRPLEFASRPDLRAEHIRTGEELDQLERAFDAVKYRRFSERPLLDIYVPTVSRPGDAPSGHDVVSVLAHFVPYQLDGGWNDEMRERVGDAVVAELETYAPGVTSSIVAREVLTPSDIEFRYGVTGGHVHHGEHALDQLITRPTLETTRYATPIAGLFLCGAGTFPGGGITCAPGALAAREVAARL